MSDHDWRRGPGPAVPGRCPHGHEDSPARPCETCRERRRETNARGVAACREALSLAANARGRHPASTRTDENRQSVSQCPTAVPDAAQTPEEMTLTTAGPTTGPDAEALVLWLHVDPDDLDPVTGPEDLYLASGPRCRRLDCRNVAQLALRLDRPSGPRWAAVCLPCWQAAVVQARPACPRPGCRRTTSTAGQWCDRDRQLVHGACTVALARWQALTSTAVLLSTSKNLGGKVGGTKTPPLPMNQAAWLLADDLHVAYVTATNWLYPDQPITVDRRHAARQIGATSVTIGMVLPRLLDHPDGRELAWQLVQLETRAMRTLGLDEQRPERRDLPCQACDLRTLITVPGQDHARCETCGLTETDDAYRVRARRWIAYGRAHRDDLDDVAAS